MLRIYIRIYTLPVLSMDGSHNAAIELLAKELKAFIPASTLLVLGTRTTNMNNLLLAFTIVMGGETEEAYNALLQHCRNMGVSLNKADTLWITDRSLSIINSITRNCPLSLHVACKRHLERNILQHPTWRKHVPLFHKAYYATSARVHMHVMEEIKEACSDMHVYLNKVKTNWARYIILQRGLMHYGIETNNIAEQINAWFTSSKGHPYKLLCHVIEYVFQRNVI